MKAEDLVKKKVQRTASDGSQVSSTQVSSTDGTSIHSSELPVISDRDSHLDNSGLSDMSRDRHQVFSGINYN